MKMAYTQKKYEESDAVSQARADLERQSASKPGDYSSRWQSELDAAVERILSRPDFSYDPGSDALYRQYRDSYTGQGRLAMMDTLGQASTLTGGYGNSYAQIAGQQAYQGYLQQLNDRIPELYQLALDRYNQQGQALYDRANLLSGQEQQDYSRYQDSLTAWNQERSYLTDRYDTERDFDYNAYRDLTGDAQWIAQFEEDQRRYDQEWAAEHPEVSASDSGSKKSSGSGKAAAPAVDVEAEYLAMKKEGETTSNLDKYLRSAVSAGLISQAAATDLRNKRY